MDQEELRLLGNVSGKRVLQLGCREASTAIAVAAQGAHVIVVVDDRDDRDRARRAVDDAEAKVELHEGDVADLAFIRADTIDAALSEDSLRSVADLDRVFRQVHRVLRKDAPLLVSFPHPTSELVDEQSEQPMLIRRSYFDRTDNRRTVGDVFTSLERAHFLVDTLLEPEGGRLPRRLILRGRKLGS
jgi:ubiquinone/menaquinone biosynthesis C-methylase UbiE